MKIYRSKVDWWLVILILSVFGFPIVQGIQTKEYMLSLVFFMLLSLFYILAITLKYKIEGDYLSIWRTKIDIKTIRKVYPTRNPLSSPALSINRIAIVYNKYDEVLISPKDRADFIEELLKVNPNIEVKL
ncbi:MAG: hypothetical protein RL427_846 [Bacteroidota bacterium]|jgi:hypothetical protein